MPVAKTGGKLDLFPNFAGGYVVETVADTAAYAKFNFPYSVKDRIALIIERIEYTPTSIQQLNSTDDYSIFGLCVAEDIPNLMDTTNPAILDTGRLYRSDFGAAASAVWTQMPFVKDFTNLSGGGLIVAPNPLYMFIDSSGAAGVVGCYVKFFYTWLELKGDEFWELVESRRIITA